MRYAKNLIRSIDPSLLPSIVRFFLEVCNEENTLSILNSLRNAFTDFLNAFISMDDNSEKQKLSSINTLLVGILKNAFLTRPKLFELYYKDMMSLCSKEKGNKDCSYEHDDEENYFHDLGLDGPRRIQTMDLWILYAVSGNSKLIVKVHTLVAKLWMAGVLDCTHLYASMHLHAHPLMDFFPSLLLLAQCTIASTRMGQVGGSASNFGLYLYKLMYEQFSSGKFRAFVLLLFLCFI